ncbi:Putative glutamate--cysteine ligase 2 [Enterobacter cloacae]|nr:Putative glutamate--cysteine ligase 2 [Enterobacter cloacae]CAH5855427.1 Putative glutamate--cysteine ligase 2 [Enterobacter cloacae]
MPLPDFKSSEPFTLGIELELQVVNPPGYDLSQDSSCSAAKFFALKRIELCTEEIERKPTITHSAN